MDNQQSKELSVDIDDELSNMFNDTFIPEIINFENRQLSTSSSRSPLPFPSIIDTTSSRKKLPAPPVLSSSSSSSSGDNHSQTSTIREEYQIRTLGTHNIARLSILPIFPFFSLTPTTTQAMPTSSRTPHLLLSNVPLESLTEEQYTRIRDHAFPSLFKLELDLGTKMLNPEKLQLGSCESFLLCFYQNLYVKLKKRLKVDIPIIDFNLTRLHNCISRVALLYNQEQTMLNMDELSLALEFYLQFDVDMFFLKTCSFNGVKPRLYENRFLEGLFCIDTPEPRFSITPCHKKHCLCCHPPCPRRYYSIDSQQQTVTTTTTTTTAAVIPFSTPHIHRFVNQYESILNCPATCESKNCIYVLTCPCNQFDFIGQSKLSFAETLKVHREESNRIIREFLIGETNIQYITYGLKSDEKKAHDKMWLYQHSPRCSVALQLFLDVNPDYWCFVPMKLMEVNIANATAAQRSSSPHRHQTTTNDGTTLQTRTDEQVRLLVENIPKPPLGFAFSIHQLQQQAHFFKWLKDCIVPRDNVDVYNADIVAILPDKSSELFQHLIQSLFITHAECKLNQIGHIVYDYFDPNRALHGSWCANLTRRPPLR